MSGYVPLVYLTGGTSAWGTSSPWAVVLDNTIVTSAQSTSDVAGRFKLTTPQRGLTDVHSRFSLLVAGTGAGADAAARFRLAAQGGRDFSARFKLVGRGRTEIFKTTSNQAATLPSQHRVATLCDGSLAVIGWDGSAEHLYRVSSANTPSPTVSSVQAFGALNSFFALPDMLVSNNGGATSDVWIADTTGVAAVQHGTYTAATQAWTWDAHTNVPGSSGNAFYIQLAWTGTYLICAYQDASHAVYMNYTNVKSGTSGWASAQVQLSAASSANGRPATVLMHDSGLAATVAVYNMDSQVLSRVLPDGLAPALANWGPEVAVVTANVGASSTSGYAYSGNLTGLIDPATKRVHIAFCDGSSATRSPGYLNGTAVVDQAVPANNKVTWGAAISVGSPATANSSPAIGVDRTSKVFLFWATSPSGATSDVKYATLVAPFAAASAETNLTNAGAANNNQPHVPSAEVLAGGFVPLIFEAGTASPYSILLDNSISAG
jgi:hypothetical protein